MLDTQQFQQLTQAQGVARTAANVERLPLERGHVIPREPEGLHEVADVENVPDLATITVQGQRTILASPDEEMGDPALVLGAELVRPIDTAHPEDDRGQAVGARVV